MWLKSGSCTQELDGYRNLKGCHVIGKLVPLSQAIFFSHPLVILGYVKRECGSLLRILYHLFLATLSEGKWFVNHSVNNAANNKSLAFYHLTSSLQTDGMLSFHYEYFARFNVS